MSYDAVPIPQPVLWKEPMVIANGPFSQVVLFTSKDSKVPSLVAKVYENQSAENQAKGYYEENIHYQLKHSNIVKCLIGPPELIMLYPNSCVIFMEYCSGGNLRQLIETSSNAFGAHQSAVMDFLLHISRGIEYLHSKQVIHRNIKPENILLQYQGQNETIYKLSDFDFAHQFSITSIFKSFVGTFQYFSPEIIKSENQEKISKKIVLPNSTVDLWAFGVTAFELITGSRPFMIDKVGPEWARHVENKFQDNIHIYTDENEQLIYSSTIPMPHRLSGIICDNLTAWLKLLLDSNPQTRGGRDPRLANKNYWFTNLMSIQRIRVINFVLLHEWVINPNQFSQEDRNESIIERFSLNIGNPNDFLLLREDGKTLDMLTHDDTLCRYRNEGYLYILPIFTKIKPKQLSFQLTPEIDKIMREGFFSGNKRKLVRMIKEVLTFFLQTIVKYETFFKGALATMNFMKDYVEKLRALMNNITCLRFSLNAVDIFVPNSTIDSTLSQLQQMSRMPHYRKTKDKILTVIQKWDGLKQICVTTKPEVNAIEDLCEDVALQISVVENVLRMYPCELYVSELENKRIAIQSLASLAIEMIEKVGYTNGVKISKIFQDEIIFFQKKSLFINNLFSTISTHPNVLLNYENEMTRASLLLKKEFIPCVSKKSAQAIEGLGSLSLTNSENKDSDRETL